MWQVYAIMARDLLEDRRRTADLYRMRHMPAKQRRSAARALRQLVTGRGED